ncbi:MAG: hypothetical protein Q8Q09_07655 [Deltaproteobacteria bacterium]|nr:hypothetical protein [Deltaproteobacteria bacterium]
MNDPDKQLSTGEQRVCCSLAYLDDSLLALRTMRKALGEKGLLLETYSQPQRLLSRKNDIALAAVLLDMDLGESVDGSQVAEALLTRDPAPAIAFFTASVAPERLARLARIGLVFDKTKDLAKAAAWLASFHRDP